MARKNKVLNKSKIEEQNFSRKLRSILDNFKFFCKIISFLTIIIILLGFNLSKDFNRSAKNIIYKKFAQENILDLKLKNVYLEGQNYSDNKDIVKCLNVKIGEPILGISLEKIRLRLEKLPWVKAAVVERRLPSILYVNIIEKEPVALWQNKGVVSLIDSDGKIISNDKLGQFTNLILIIGNDAAFHYNNLYSLIRRNKEIFSKISSVTRIGERRWNIKMKTGTEIKLPETREKKAWEIVEKLFKKGKLTGELKMIDLRIEGKIFINGELEDFQVDKDI